jgi:Uma2 family endonuclease
MSTVASKLMTADEFYDWSNRPENSDKYCELERGEIVEMTRPGKLHGFVCANVVAILTAYCRQRKKGYVCSNDTGVIVERDPDTVRGPDVLLFEDADHIEAIDRKWGKSPPLLAIEVLSPNDTFAKINRRVQEQLRFGTPLVWVLDPDANNVTVYRPGQPYYVVERDEELTGNDMLPDFRCKVAEFFTMPGQ